MANIHATNLRAVVVYVEDPGDAACIAAAADELDRLQEELDSAEDRCEQAIDDAL